jgi:hypothetical protein
LAVAFLIRDLAAAVDTAGQALSKSLATRVRAGGIGNTEQFPLRYTRFEAALIDRSSTSRVKDQRLREARHSNCDTHLQDVGERYDALQQSRVEY